MADCVIRKMPTQSATDDELQSFRPHDQFVEDGLLLGFTSIRQYRDIDRGIGDLEIIAAPRDRMISYTNACLACTLLNRIHRAIIMMSQGRSPDTDTWPVGDRAPPRDLAAQHTLHNATLFDPYYAHSYPDPPYSSRR